MAARIPFVETYYGETIISSSSYAVAQPCPVTNILGNMKAPGVVEYVVLGKELEPGAVKIVSAFPSTPFLSYTIKIVGTSCGNNPEKQYDDTNTCFEILRTCNHKNDLPFIKMASNSYKEENAKSPMVDVRIKEGNYEIFTYGSLLGGNVMAKVTIFIMPTV